MKMDYSVAKQFGSKIPENKVSTEEIKAGLQRIKKAQQQVLQQLKRNHPDYSIDVRTSNSQIYRIKTTQNQNLKRQLNIQRQKSTQKSTLYRRRVVDLQSSLTIHAQHQQKLKREIRILQDENKGLQSQNRILHEQIRALKLNYSDLQKDYERLIQQSERSNKNLRILQKQVMQFNNKLQQGDVKSLRAEFQIISAQRNSIMSEKVTLLKNYSKLQSENIELRMRLNQITKQHQVEKQKLKQRIKQKQYERQKQRQSQKRKHKQQLKQTQFQNLQKNKRKQQKQITYRPQDVNMMLAEIHKMNSSHQFIFTTLKSNTKLSPTIIDKQNSYQNSLNKILQKLYNIQKNQLFDNSMLQYKFDHEQSFKEQIQRIQFQFAKKHKKQHIKYTAQRQDLLQKNKSKDKKIQQLHQQNIELQSKLTEIRKQKTQLIQQITQLNRQVSQLRENSQKRDKQRYNVQSKKQQQNQQQYRTIIVELNQQMGTIQKQKRDLDNLVRGMANNKSQEQMKNKKKLNEIIQVNQEIKLENEKIKGKYQTIFLEKQQLYLSLNQCQNKNNNLTKQIARQVLQKQKLIAQLNRIKQEKDLSILQVQKYKLLSQNTRKQSENINNSYLLEIQRLIHEGLYLRKQIQQLVKDRNQLRDLKAKYGLLMKDAQLLGKQVKHVNNQLDHLWMIKQVQYNNVNKIVNQLKPL